MRPFSAAGVVGALCIALCLAPSVAAAQDVCPSEGHFEGRVDTQAVRAYFSNGYPATEPNQLLGVFIYTATWSSTDDTFALDGTVAVDCSIRFDEVDNRGRNRGSWLLRLVDGHFEGTRMETPGAASAAVVLRPSTEPDCSGSGPWQMFRSEEWPITFSYPSSWRLSEHDYGIGGEHEFGIELTCPDPERLSSGGFSITLVRGTAFRPFETEQGRKGELVNLRFVRARGGPWMAGDEECLDADPDRTMRCAVARTTRRFGMTVLQGSSFREHRLYRPGGGYVGQGPGVLNYLFIRGGEWVTLDSEDPPAWDDDILRKPGPVRFDGAGVTERLVRSVRPR